MRVNITYKIEHDINRSVYTLKRLLEGLYGTTIFYVVEELPKKHEDAARCALLPPLYKLSSNQIKSLQKIEHNELVSNAVPFFDRTTQNTIMDAINAYDHGDLNAEKVISDWKKVEKDFQTILNTIFPGVKLENNYQVLLTRFGTVGGYHSKDPILFVRDDYASTTIAELILTKFVRASNTSYTIRHSTDEHIFEDTIRWACDESIVDFLFLHTPLRELFPDYIPTLLSTQLNNSEKLRIISENTLKKYGITKNKDLELENGKIKINSQNRYLTNLTEQDKLVLEVLIANSNESITYDHLAKVIWGDDYLDKFSLNALNKAIYTIRSKLDINKVLSAKIQTLRGKGYMLVQ